MTRRPDLDRLDAIATAAILLIAVALAIYLLWGEV